MSQRNVEFVIGRLLTDEELRERFIARPFDTIVEFLEQGWNLSRREIDAFVQSDIGVWTWGASHIHPRLQQCSLRSH
jgi:hypothetical protein